jgi:hypothetical protein
LHTFAKVLVPKISKFGLKGNSVKAEAVPATVRSSKELYYNPLYNLCMGRKKAEQARKPAKIS